MQHAAKPCGRVETLRGRSARCSLAFSAAFARDLSQKFLTDPANRPVANLRYYAVPLVGPATRRRGSRRLALPAIDASQAVSEGRGGSSKGVPVPNR
jgi:hypothetical protein